MVLFNPGDNHACTQADGGTLDYRGLNITKEVMLELAEEVTGKGELPGFSQNVIRDEEVICYLRPLHEMVMQGISDLGKEENLLLMLSGLIQNYGQPFERCIPECRQEIEKACRFMEQHFSERISLEQICRQVGLSKSTLLRAFTKSRGIRPTVTWKRSASMRRKKCYPTACLPLKRRSGQAFQIKAILRIISPAL